MAAERSAGAGRKALVINVLLSAGVTLLMIAGLEGGARIVESRRPPSVIADYIWNWEQKWEGDFYTIRSEGVGWPPWEEFNGDGLRDRTHSAEPAAGITRVAFLGDSVTLGAGIEAHQAYPQRLQQRFDAEGRPVEVLNVSLWGWSTRQERLAYARIARRYQPQQVVLGVCLNDIPELQNNLTQPPRWLTALHQRSALVRLLVDAQGREIGSVELLFQEPDSPRVREAFDRFFAEVRALRDEVRGAGRSFVVIVFPFRFQVLPDAPAPVVQQRIEAFCRSEELTCLDVLPALQPLGDSGFVDYDHLTPAGADAVASAIVSRGLLTLPRTRPETLQPLLPEGALDWTVDRLPAASATAATPNAGKEGDVDDAAPTAAGPAVRRNPPPGSVAALVELLPSPDPAVRAAAAWAIGRAAADAAAAVPRLMALLQDADPAVRREAAAAIGAVGKAASDAVPRLLTLLADERDAVRFAAAQALHAIGVTSSEVPALAAALSSTDPYVRGFASWTLGSLGDAAAPALPALIDALSQPDAYGRAGAASAIARMGPAAAAAVPALLQGLRDPDGNKRWKAARALGRIGGSAAPAVPALTEALRDPNENVRRYSARALGRIGVPARSAAAELERTRGDQDEAVRREAQDALDRIRQ